MKKINSIKILIVAVLIFLYSYSNATTIVAVANGNWSNSAIWSIGVIPASTDDVVIPAGIFVYYDIPVLIDSGGSVTINGALCGQDTFRILCGGYFSCYGLMSGIYIGVTDGFIGPLGRVYARNAFNVAPCSTGFFNNGSATVGLPFSCTHSGINQINFVKDLGVSPNPFSNFLRVSGRENESIEIVLYDITGRKIFNQSFTNTISLYTSLFAKGIYFYEARNQNGDVKKGKVVKD